MKKLALLLLPVLLLSGCTKNYKTVEEYESEMQAVRKANSYIVEIKQQTPMAELYYKSYVKGDKWKTELSMNNGASYMTTVLYDGVDLLSYSSGTPYAVVNPAMEMVDDEDPEYKVALINSQNPVNPIFHWYDDFSFVSNLTSAPNKGVFEDNKANKNGFDCRMIKFSEDREACVSDKYGIAVYYKIKFEDPRKPGEIQETIFNLVKIEESEILDSEFELPQGVKKMSLEGMLDHMDKMLENRFK